MTEEYLDYVEDIIAAMNDAESFVKHEDFSAFLKDKKTIYATIRALEIIGEAVKHIPSSIKNSHPQIPWKEMTGMRDKVIHEYFGVDLRRVWLTIKGDIPKTKPIFEKILNDSK